MSQVAREQEVQLAANISRITPPLLPHILSRPRLLDLLEKHRDKRLTLILGQGAQGKTTLAAEYVKKSRIPSAWINLERADSDPVDLFHMIVQSLQFVFKDIDFSPLRRYPLIIAPRRSEIPFLQERIRSLYERIVPPVQIVIDGLDCLPSDAPSLELLWTMSREATPNIRLIMLARETPPSFLDLQHLTMNQQAFILTNEDLAFTQDESWDYLRKVQGLPSMNREQLKKIQLATEGWIGGLLLLSEYLSRLPEGLREKCFTDGLPDRLRKEFFSYFATEIYSSQKPHIQEFLVRSSIVNPIYPGFIKDLIGLENAEEILQKLTKRNLFVQSFYEEEKGWSFQYHQMFRNFLQAKHRSTIGDEEQQRLLLKVGTLYEQRGELENAVQYFLDGKAYPRAASAIERFGTVFWQTGRRTDLARWIGALPEDIVHGNPWLLYYTAITRMYIAGRENVVLLKRARALFKKRGDTPGYLLSLSRMIDLSIEMGAHLEPLQELMKEGEALLESLELDKYPYEKAALWESIGMGHILWGGDVRRGILACQNACLISGPLRDNNLQAKALSTCFLGQVFLGEFGSAEETCRKIEKLIEKRLHPEIQVFFLLVSSVLAIHQGQFEKVPVLLETLQGEIEKFGFVSLSPFMYEISCHLRLFRGEFLKAEEIGNQYLSTATTLKNDFFKTMALRLLSLVYCHRGDFEKAKEAIDQSIRGFTTEARSVWELQRMKVLRALICHHLHEDEAAEEELKGPFEYFSKILDYHSLALIHLVTAFVRRGQGRKSEAASSLEKGFQIAEQKKYEHFSLLGREGFAQACLLAIELKVEGASDYAAHLLSTGLCSVAEEGLRKLSNHRDAEVREKVLEIRKTIHRSKAPRLRIKTLGGFEVLRGDSPVEEKEWHGDKSKALLKVIITRGSRRIHGEVLTEDLWPEGGGESMERAFKVTLHRLRKTLEPAMDKSFGSSYVHLKDNIISLDEALCEVDFEQFLSLLKQGKEVEKKGDTREALSLYEKAMAHYGGEFLPDDLYASWAQLKREELKDKCCQFLLKIAELYEGKGTFAKAIVMYKRAIDVDCFFDEAYQRLMLLYSNTGRRNQALDLYRAYEQALRDELQTKPSELMVAIYKKILEESPSG